MADRYQIILRTPTGVLLNEIEKFSRLDYALTENDVGAMTLTVADEVPYAWLQEDAIAEIWRQVDGGPITLEGDTVWFVRLPDTRLSQTSQTTNSLVAYDAKSLLKRRIIAYKSTTAQASKTTYYDDMCKAIVRENYGSLATDALRDLSAYLSVAPDASLAPNRLKSFSFRVVLLTLQDIAAASASLGTYLGFDIVKTGDLALQFRTYIGQRGQDLRSVSLGSGVVVSPEFGSIAEASVASDYTQEVTVAYGGGAGQDVNRSLRTLVSPRATATPFNRIEVFLDMASSSDTEIDNALASTLWDGRPRQWFTGRLVDAGKGPRYGLDYHWGDLVTAQWRNLSFGVRVNPVHVTVDENGTSVDSTLNGDNLI